MDHARLKRPDLSEARIRGRYAAERRFRFYGQFAVGLAIAMLGVLLFSVCSKGYSAFYRAEIALDIMLDPAVITPDGKSDADTLASADYQGLLMRWGAGAGLRMLGVVAIPIAVVADRALFPPLFAALGYIAVLVPLFFFEIRRFR